METTMKLAELNGLIFTTADREEAEPFIEKWHYSGSLNASMERAFTMRTPGGLFGDRGEILACCCFSHPVNRNAKAGEVELIRLARIEDPPDELKLSFLVSRSLRWLRLNTDYKMVVSYADSTHEHHGGIYQATNFYYVAVSKGSIQGFRNPETGEYLHKRSAYGRFGTSSEKYMKYEEGWESVRSKDKYLYVFPLVKKMKRRLALLAEYGYKPLPYPKPEWPGGIRPDD